MCQMSNCIQSTIGAWTGAPSNRCFVHKGPIQPQLCAHYKDLSMPSLHSLCSAGERRRSWCYAASDRAVKHGQADIRWGAIPRGGGGGCSLASKGSCAQAMRGGSSRQAPGDGVLVAKLVQEWLHKVGAQQTCQGDCGCGNGRGCAQLLCNWNRQSHGDTAWGQCPCNLCTSVVSSGSTGIKRALKQCIVFCSKMGHQDALFTQGQKLSEHLSRVSGVMLGTLRLTTSIANKTIKLLYTQGKLQVIFCIMVAPKDQNFLCIRSRMPERIGKGEGGGGGLSSGAGSAPELRPSNLAMPTVPNKEMAEDRVVLPKISGACLTMRRFWL